MQHDRTRADQGAVVDGAALEVGEVPDHAVVADDRGEHRGGVDDGAVLDRGARPDLDVPVVAPEHRLGPDRGARADGDVADHGGLGVDVGVGMNPRLGVAEGVDRHGD